MTPTPKRPDPLTRITRIRENLDELEKLVRELLDDESPFYNPNDEDLLASAEALRDDANALFSRIEG